PNDVEFYLVDFKKGVEFKCYGNYRLPHARVVAIESDREFGMSVLSRIDEELRRRGELFRKLGVQDLQGYKRAGGTESLPRSLLIVDEFQEFFVEDDRIAQNASLLLDRLVRQGRAFGIHVLLGSQTLGGAYTLAQTTLGQMVVRIALQCNEADSYLIMEDNNPAPRLLSRPGEAIYNDATGSLEGNSPFQIVWLPDEERDGHLERIRERADADGRKRTGPIVFEGNAPADVTENPLLIQALENEAEKLPPFGRLWLGAPNSIKGPTEARFQRQSGNNLLVVGQREDTVLNLFTIGLVTLAAQYPPETVRLILLDASQPGSEQQGLIEEAGRALPPSFFLGNNSHVDEIMNELVQEMDRRNLDDAPGDEPPVFVFVNGLQKFKKLRVEDEFSFSLDDDDAAPDPAAQFNQLISDGSSVGIHMIVACDTYNNLNRWLSRKAVGEFEKRVLFQMSMNDSASLIDSPAAGSLGLYRAIYYNEQEGYIETFRPYARPAANWFDEARDVLSPVAT
ncbi:MAG: FtsK/SpoIIIE domain-containing protein, partial [Verrucomicrobiota bacterium]